MQAETRHAVRRTGIAIAALWIAIAVSAAVVAAIDLFLLSMLGIVIAVCLSKTSQRLSQAVGLSYGWALGTVVLLLTLIVSVLLVFFSAQIEGRIQSASADLDNAQHALTDWVSGHPLAKSALSNLPFAGQLLSEPSRGAEQSPSPSTDGELGAQANGSSKASQSSTGSGLSSSRLGQAARIVAQVFQTTLGAVTNMAIVFFVGLYLAADPNLYRNGFVRLFPRAARDRAREILDEMESTLWSWLLGRFATMTITGVGAGISLAILGVPMPVTLGVLSGLLAFIPNIGPAIALAITVFVALPQGGQTALMVVPVFVVLQLLESYVATPIIQQRLVSIPPALLIFWQVLLGMLAGFLGLTVATPMLAAILVVVRMAYLEDALGGDAPQSS